MKIGERYVLQDGRRVTVTALCGRGQVYVKPDVGPVAKVASDRLLALEFDRWRGFRDGDWAFWKFSTGAAGLKLVTVMAFSKDDTRAFVDSGGAHRLVPLSGLVFADLENIPPGALPDPDKAGSVIVTAGAYKIKGSLYMRHSPRGFDLFGFYSDKERWVALWLTTGGGVRAHVHDEINDGAWDSNVYRLGWVRLEALKKGDPVPAFDWARDFIDQRTAANVAQYNKLHGVG